MSVGLPSGSVQVRRIIYSGESEPIAPVFYDDIADVNTNVLVLDTVLEYDPLIRIQGYYWNGIRNVPIPDTPEFVLPQVPSATLILDLEADTLVLSDGDPVSTWADQSGNGNDFTQAGGARPTKQTIGGYSAVTFDGVDDWMDGGNAADNLPGFAVFVVVQVVTETGSNWVSKYESGVSGAPGWVIEGWQNEFIVTQDNSNYIDLATEPFIDDGVKGIACGEFIDSTHYHAYTNGVENVRFDGSAGTVANFSTAIHTVLATDIPNHFGYSNVNMYAVLIYQITDPANWATDRAAITAWLAARYGITL